MMGFSSSWRATQARAIRISFRCRLKRRPVFWEKNLLNAADILDVDHLVPDMGAFFGMLQPGQVFSGKSDPVGLIQNGTPEKIAESVRQCRREAGGRVIVSAGCEVPPDTTVENMRAFRAAAG